MPPCIKNLHESKHTKAMKFHWLQQKGSQHLVIFCNGWGMDPTPVSHLRTIDQDLLVIYDYTDLELQLEFEPLFQNYSTCTLICWSMGVWAGQYLFGNYRDRFSSTIAINGTLCPIHDDYGIPVEVYSATLRYFSETSRLKLYKRMCGGRDAHTRFLSLQPQRSLSAQEQELASLIEYVDCSTADSSIYKNILISKKDRVVPTGNQMAFWQQEHTGKIHSVEGGHYPFSGFQSWQELIDFNPCSGQ